MAMKNRPKDQLTMRFSVKIDDESQKHRSEVGDGNVVKFQNIRDDDARKFLQGQLRRAGLIT